MSDDQPTRDEAMSLSATEPDPRGSIPKAPQPRFAAGSKISHYEVLEQIGHGGMGEVYLARDTRLGRRVALKFLLRVDPKWSARFFVEARATAQLAHENIVSLHDIAEHGGLPYMVLEYVQGKTLSTWLQERRRGNESDSVPPLQAAEIMLPVARALQCAHEAGVVHRDLKLANIMLTKSGTVKVLDFGVAKLIDTVESETVQETPEAWAKNALGTADLTETGVMIGTRSYMAPEQWWGEDVDGRTDIWAVGIMLYQMVTGNHPLAPLTPESLVKVSRRDTPMPSVFDALPSIGELGEVIDQCLRKDKKERLGSAQELCEALERITRHSTSIRGLSYLSDRPVDLGEGSRSGNSPTGSTGLDKQKTPVPEESSNDAKNESSNPANRVTPPSASSKAAPRSIRWPLILALFGVFAIGIGIASSWGRQEKQGSLGVSSMTTTPPACTSNAECMAKSDGKAALCRKDTGTCVQLENKDCRVLADKQDLENDTTIWLGAMYPFGENNGLIYGRQAVKAVELARRDFKDFGGIPATTLGGKPRSIGVVLCDDSEESERIAKHLVEEVNVPVILGFARSKEVMDLSTAFFLPKGVLALASNTASMLVDIPHPPGEPRLVLRVTTSADMVNRPKAAVIEGTLEPVLKSRGVLRANEAMRIAIVRSNNASGVSHADKLISFLRWNGKSAIENGELVQQFVFPDELERKDKPDAVRTIADAVVAFMPHVIVEAGLDQEPFITIEQRWLATTKFRPIYLTSGPPGDAKVEKFMYDDPDVARRVFSVNTIFFPPLMKFVIHHNEIFTDEKIDPFSSTSAPYDAFYTAAYAIIALGDAPITGRALSHSIRRLVPPGEPIDVGPAGIYRAAKVLRDGKNIDLAGSQTSLDFDPETGDPTADFALRCIDSVKRTTIESGLVFEAKSGKLVGTLKCP